MNLAPLNWQLLSLTHQFNQTTCPTHFFDFQPNAKLAIDLLVQAKMGSALVLKSETLPEYFAEITAYFAEKYPEIQVVSKTEYNPNHLFGYSCYLEQEKRIEHIIGAIQQAHNGILILNINALLLNISQWDKIKQALLFGEYEANMITPIPAQLTPIKSQFKLILVGGRDDIATLLNYDDSLYQFAQYSELNSYLDLGEDSLPKWGDYLQTLSQKLTGITFTSSGLNQLLHFFIRESESQDLISINPTLLKKHLTNIANFYQNQTAISDISSYLNYLEQNASVLHQYALKDILTQQIYLETDDEIIGQVNGLSVVEFDGVPYPFGEPVRISCNVQYGDGEIHDIERKVELGGNLHAKGIMLAQSCLANLLELPTQLPFSATLAFEQSYGEIDGDSSSLAIFCVLVSALAKLPLPQQFAVTGAIDQFGNVLSVGGVNQKIESFFNVCQARSLTGKQGVIIPSACVSHLSLKSDVIEAVKQGQFQIWAVSDIFEATQILFDRAFYDDEEPQKSPEDSLFSLIHQYIEENQNRNESGSFWAKFCKWRGKD